ncbi:hypothetical protein [Campylobacter sp. RM16187]|uniref:hypothetical protein n=1 Tax=Campylobacter sp. RM16187 TaxID=1660063 RepID=UPI0021B5C736|nr:hypothetical protein [Campylobacter sp. RM16187]QKG30012.1 hypothetical protein CDOMF_1783 [Campylobacter sp. RM16187]
MPRIIIQTSAYNIKKIKEFVTELKGKSVINENNELQKALKLQRECNKRLRARIREAYAIINKKTNHQ